MLTECCPALSCKGLDPDWGRLPAAALTQACPSLTFARIWGLHPTLPWLSLAPGQRRGCALRQEEHGQPGDAGGPSDLPWSSCEQLLSNFLSVSSVSDQSVSLRTMTKPCAEDDKSHMEVQTGPLPGGGRETSEGEPGPGTLLLELPEVSGSSACRRIIPSSASSYGLPPSGSFFFFPSFWVFLDL